MELIVDFNPRLNYGRNSPEIKKVGQLGWRIESGANIFALRSDVGLVSAAKGLSAKFRLEAGDKIAFSLTLSAEGPAVLPPLAWVGVRVQLSRTL